MRDWRDSGGSLIEVLIALLVFSVVAVGLAQTLVVALRARRTSDYWMRATQLAVERLEQARSGHAQGGSETVEMYRRRVVVQPGFGSLPLERVDVSVEWQDDGPKTFTLSLLQRTVP